MKKRAKTWTKENAYLCNGGAFLRKFLILIFDNGAGQFSKCGSVLKSHACAASCIASRNHTIKKLETHIADKKNDLKSSLGQFVILLYTISVMLSQKKRLTTKKTPSPLFAQLCSK